MALGASGVMVAPPPTLRTDDQIVAYFEMVQETLGPNVPWVLQDHPVATGVQMSAAVIVRIIRNAPSCVMLKHEDCPGLAKLSAIRAASQRGDMHRVSILTGNGGGLFLPEELARGADGAMTGFAYPEMMVGVCHAFAAGDVARAHDLFDAYLPLARYEQQPGIGLAVRKHLLAERGVIASAALRKPGPRLSAADIADIAHLVTRQNPAPGRPRLKAHAPAVLVQDCGVCARLAPRQHDPHPARPGSMERPMIKLSVNGKLVSIDADADMPLLWALREQLQLTGTKFGCGMGLCGACTVHLDGTPVRACSTPMSAAAGKRVTTIEAIGNTRTGKAVQAAWIHHDVPQCGYCQSGQIMSACALLAEKGKPTDADIDGAMSGNLCRCGTYNQIRAAIKDASVILAKGA